MSPTLLASANELIEWLGLRQRMSLGMVRQRSRGE
jgi:hypothetical protein